MAAEKVLLAAVSPVLKGYFAEEEKARVSRLLTRYRRPTFGDPGLGLLERSSAVGLGEVKCFRITMR